jgi:hypothetical protein
MADAINVPGLGSVPKKYAIGAVATAAGLGVIVYLRARSAAKAAAAAPAVAAGSGQVTDPAGNTCAALDPNSGYCPGSPEDTAYQETATGDLSGLGYGGNAGTGISEAGLVTDPAGNQCTAVDPVTGYCPGTPQDLQAQGASGASAGSTAGASTITTNSEWLQEALTLLPGGDTSANEAALAGVIGGLTVTTAQMNIFNEAVGLLGEAPPQGYPQPIKTSDTSGQPAKTAAKAGAISNLQQSGSTVRWNAASGATGGYAIRITGPQSKSATVKATSYSLAGLKKGSYNFGIQGLPGGPGDNIHVTVS